MTEDYPPENYVEKGTLKGYAVDILRAMWKQMGVEESPIQVLPWARAFSMLENGEGHVLFAMARNPERENKFKWVGPIFHSRCSLFMAAGRTNRPPGLEAVRGSRIGVLRQDICQSIMEKHGFTGDALTQISQLSQLLRMVKLGRLDYICTSPSAIAQEFTRDAGLAFPFVEVLVVEDFTTWYAFHKSTDDAVIRRFNEALAAIDQERRAIISKYREYE